MSLAPPIINESTSVVQVDTASLQNGNYSLIYLSTTTTPDQLVTIRDATGFLSSPQAIVVSSLGGASFEGGVVSTVLQQRFSYLSLHSDTTGRIWTYVNRDSFPDPGAAPSVRDTATRTTLTSTLQISGAVSTVRAQVVQAELNAITASTVFYASTFYINSLSDFQTNPARFRATVNGDVKLYGSTATTGSFFPKGTISTGADFFARGNVSTKAGTFFVGSNVAMSGSLRSPRAFFQIGGVLSTIGGGPITGPANVTGPVIIAQTLGASNTSTPTMNAATLNATSSIVFRPTTSAVQYRRTGINFATSSITIPTFISTTNANVSTLAASTVETTSFGTSSQQLRFLTLSTAAIINAEGSLNISSIAGDTLSALTSVSSRRAFTGGQLAGSIRMNDQVISSLGISISFPPYIPAPYGTSNLSSYWMISSIGTNGSLTAPFASLSTNFVAATSFRATELRSITNDLTNFQATAATVLSSFAFTSTATFQTLSTPILNINGRISGSISTFAENAAASTVITNQITTPGTARFVGQSSAAFSTVLTSSLTSRDINTSSVFMSGGIFGAPAFYSTINPSSTWLLTSTFNLNTPPFNDSVGLGTYFYDVVYSAAANSKAYYSIIDPLSRVPIFLSTPYVNTVIGTGTAGYTGEGGPASNARIGKVIGQAAVDSTNTLSFGDNTIGWRLRKISPSGITSTVAGNYRFFYGDAGPPTLAALSPRLAVSIPSPGVLLVTDVSNVRLRQTYFDINFNPFLTTIAGTGAQGYSGDGGLAPLATFSNPGMTVANASGNTIYLADTSNNMIRRILNSTITRYAGASTAGASGDGGVASTARFSAPFGLAMSPTNNLFITDTGNSVVRQISTSTDIVQKIAGTYVAGFSGDGGAATSAQLNRPRGITLDADSNVIIADSANHRIRKITAATGVINTIAGTGSAGYSGDGGAPTSATFSSITGVTADEFGNIYVADTNNQVVRYINLSTNTVTTVAGIPQTGGYNGDGTFATFSLLSNPSHVIYDKQTKYCYIADDGNARIRYIDTNAGILYTAIGNGSPTSTGDGSNARYGVFASIHSVATDFQGRATFVAEAEGNKIRCISTATGILTTTAGTGAAGYGGDGGPATSALLSSPNTVVLDATSNIYFTDTNNHRVRCINASTGQITTIAGNGIGTYAGDGGLATSASLHFPRALTVDSPRNLLYIGDTSNYRIRRVNLNTGLITTFAGTGTNGTILPGLPALNANIDTVTAVTVNSTGTLYFVDTVTNGLWRVNPTTTLLEPQNATSSAGAYIGDAAPLSNAAFNNPLGYYCDPFNNFVISDSDNFRIRRTYEFGNSNFPRYLNMDLEFTNYFTTNGFATIAVNGSTIRSFDAVSGSNISYSLNELDIWSIPLQGSNPTLGDQTPWLEITMASNNGYVKLAGVIWMNMYPGQEGGSNTIDSNAGIIMNQGVIRFPFRNNGTTVDNRYNDTSLRTLTYTGSINSVSDPALKDAIAAADLTRCASTLAALPLRSYRYITAYTSTFHTDPAPRLGFLTTEVAPYFPHSISKQPLLESWGPSTIQTLELSQLKAAHLGATQALQQQVTAMERELRDLQAAITAQRNTEHNQKRAHE